MCKGDVPVDVHSAEDYEESEEYVVDSIVAQKGRGKNMHYMVKWKVGFALCLAYISNQLAHAHIGQDLPACSSAT